MPHHGLQETQSLERQAYCGLCHVQTHPGNLFQRWERTACSTGTAVQIQNRDKGSVREIIGKEFPADQGIATFPAEQVEVAVA